MKKFLCILLSMIMILGMLSGCGGDSKTTSSSDEKSDKSITVITREDESTLDPAKQAGNSRTVTNIYENLLKLRESDGELIPQVAKSWSISDDGLEYTFDLYEDNKFHNGDSVTAEDVKFTLDRAKEIPNSKMEIVALKEVIVEGPHKVKLILEYPYGPFLKILTLQKYSILDKKVVEAAGDEYGQEPIGSGPYKFKDWKKGDRVVIEANEDYHLGAPEIKEVIFKAIGDRTTQVLSMQKGESDVLFELPSTEIENFRNNEDFVCFDKLATFNDQLHFNNETAPFDDVRVRKAITQAINLDDTLVAYTGGIGIIPDSYVMESVFGYDPNIKRFPTDMEASKKLLADAGYADGFETSITVGNEDAAILAQVVQANLAELGITAEIKQFEQSTFLEKEASGDFELIVEGVAFYAGDADTGLYSLFHSDCIGVSNIPRYNNPKVDKLIMDGRLSSDKEERLKIYSDIQNILHDDCPTVLLDIPILVSAARNNLVGVEAATGSEGELFIWEWSLKK